MQIEDLTVFGGPRWEITLMARKMQPVRPRQDYIASRNL